MVLMKTGEGGIILIPGATILDSYTDEDEELRSLEGPPSPCDVEFLNISFVDSIPEIFEYPSETSLLFDEVPSPVSNSTLGHSVPNLSGSTLSNYTPKGTEDFQLGVTRSIQSSLQTVDKDETDKADLMKEAEEPIAFSAGTNSDILF
ncbi:unnamed protein product [Brassicogethes aeneus]|uniref:Uncharacterized protein n=1 Tax=Brassicogethes aeneus TaxID=1431903 RepID=A0A9P0FHJ6_BRAAE|nr:unnamed protein product [Brassicogethes aeneus]